VNFKNFTLKKYPNVYCIGEMLDIDAVTGGFNFQACWTGAYLALDIGKILIN
jgi:predicted flavoprotein YhiN